MALTNTLATLRTLVRQRADMVGSEFISDSELTGYVNSSLAELHDMLVTMFEEYFTKSGSLTVTSAGTVALPADFYKLRGLFLTVGTSLVPLKAISLADVWRYTSPDSAARARPLVYLMFGGSLAIYPTARAAGVYSIIYASTFTPLVADGDLPFVGSGVPDQFWDEYVVVDGAIKCLQKEESDVSLLMAQKDRLTKRIVNASASRDAGDPAHILDSDSDTPEWPWWTR